MPQLLAGEMTGCHADPKPVGHCEDDCGFSKVRNTGRMSKRVGLVLSGLLTGLVMAMVSPAWAAAQISEADFVKQAQQELPDTQHLQPWLDADSARKEALARSQALFAQGKADKAASNMEGFIKDYLYVPGNGGINRSIKRQAAHLDKKLSGDEGALAAIHRYTGDLWLQAGDFRKASDEFGAAYDEYALLIPDDPRLIPFLQRRLQVAATACSKVSPARRGALGLNKLTVSPIGDASIKALGVKTSEEAACLGVPRLADSLYSSWKKHFGSPSKSTSQAHAQGLLFALQLALTSGYIDYVGNRLYLNDFMDGTHKADLDTYFPDQDFPLRQQMAQRIPLANLMTHVMILRQQPVRAVNMVKSISTDAKSSADRLALLELGATVYGKLKEVKARKPGESLYGMLSETVLPAVHEKELDATQKQRLEKVRQWLMAHR